MEALNDNVGENSVGQQSNTRAFTFVPVVQNLPMKHIITEEEEPRSDAPTRNTDKTGSALHEETVQGRMSDLDHFKMEKVFFNKCLEEMGVKTTSPECDLRPPSDHMGFFQSPAASSVGTTSENTTQRYASMGTAADKHRGISQTQSHDSPRNTEVSLGHFSNKGNQAEDRISPTDLSDLFPTPASSRESILSDGLDKVLCTSVTSPASLSRTVSPCSSVLSGIFSPAVVPIKRHFLAPGSSLINIPQTCLSSCESLSSSACPQSPPLRHRPPLTRLSLLTAILRKGRLPVLSSELQRPYTPCWPVNPVTLSFCNACSAASSVASIPLEFTSQFSSSTSIDSQSNVHRDAHRCTTAPPAKHSVSHTKSLLKRLSEPPRPSSAPKWERVLSPPPKKSSMSARVPLPRFCSDFASIIPSKPDIKNREIPREPSHTTVSISKTPEQFLISPHMLNKDSLQSNQRQGLSPATNPMVEPKQAAPQQWSHQPNSSLSRLHSLSQRLRSPPVFPQYPRCTAASPSSTTAASPLSPPQNTNRMSERGSLPYKSAKQSHALPKSPNLPPSCYTPTVLPGRLSPSSPPTPTPSPAPTVRDLTPSPLLSLRCTPSPRPGSGISDCSDGEGKKRKTHRIKSSYKSLAAIPTNTLLQDQQAIDEQVERKPSPCDKLYGGVVDTHALMCSPAELRQQSDELYAVIDDVLATSTPESSRPSSTNAYLQTPSSCPKSLGRETKYATICSLDLSHNTQRKVMDDKKTKPGIIRPMTAIPRLRMKDADEIHWHRFKQPTLQENVTDSTVVENARAEKLKIDVRKGKLWSEELKPEESSPSSACELQIRETEGEISDSRRDVLTATDGRTAAFQTPI